MATTIPRRCTRNDNEPCRCGCEEYEAELEQLRTERDDAYSRGHDGLENDVATAIGPVADNIEVEITQHVRNVVRQRDEARAEIKEREEHQAEFAELKRQELGERDKIIRRWQVSCRAAEAEAELLRGSGLRDRAQMSVILNTIGGTVEGRPTASINYLQRLRELVEKEAEVDKLRALLQSARPLLDAHHRHQGELGDTNIAEEGDEPVILNLGAEYCDSGLYDNTVDLLDKIRTALPKDPWTTAERNPDTLIRVNVTKTCAAGHEYVTSFDTPGNCWCGDKAKNDG